MKSVEYAGIFFFTGIIIVYLWYSFAFNDKGKKKLVNTSLDFQKFCESILAETCSYIYFCLLSLVWKFFVTEIRYHNDLGSSLSNNNNDKGIRFNNKPVRKRDTPVDFLRQLSLVARNVAQVCILPSHLGAENSI